MAEETTTTGISLNSQILELARVRAKRERRSLSGHAAKLLELDLISAGWLGPTGELTDVGRAALGETPKEAAA